MSESEQQQNTLISSTDDVATVKTSNAPSAAAPPPTVKRFSSANISKKFLQKTPTVSRTSSQNSVARAVTPATTTAAASTSTNNTAPAHHSRLVTTKLTSSAGTTTSAVSASGNTSGWPSRSTAPSPAAVSSVTSTNGTPGGPIIVSPATNISADGSSSTQTKTAWSKRAPSSEAPTTRVAVSDFPTAAEVAQAELETARANKPQPPASPQLSEVDVTKAAAVTAAQKDAQTADAFRGVHLDPNAHHWDDEDEDADFFADVLEFADGRQYNVSHAPPDAAGSSNPEPTDASGVPGSTSSTQPAGESRRPPNDDHDYDRTWPRGNNTHHPPPPRSHYTSSPRVNGQPLVSPAHSHTTLMSDRDRDRDHHHWQNAGDRHLFNERSNRLEPYSGSKAGDRGTGSAWSRGPPPHFNSRDRDPPPHQMHSAKSPGSQHSTLSPSNSRNNNAWGDRDRRMDQGDRGGFSRGAQSFRRGPSDRDRDMPPPRSPVENSWTRGRRASNVSAHSAMSGSGGLGITGLTSAAVKVASISVAGPDEQHGSVPGEESAQSTSGAQEATVPPTVEVLITPMNLTEVTKVAMHSAAERARIRRQEEEAEREREKERARKKADELEKIIRERQEKEKEERERKEREERERVEKERAEKEEKERKERKEREEKERAKISASKPLDSRDSATAGSSRPKLALLPRSIPVSTDSRPNESLTAPLKSPAPVSTKLPATAVSPAPVTPALPPVPSSRADDTGSWRTNAGPPRAPRSHPPTSNAPPAMSNVSHAIEALNSAVAEKAADFEVIDFSDMGKLLVGESPGVSSVAPKRRPVASDFIEDDSPKRPIAGGRANDTPDVATAEDPATAFLNSVVQENKEAPPLVMAVSPTRKTVPLAQKSPTQHSSYQPRDKNSLPYKEAPLSSLSDAMSRIKATLDNMHQASTSSLPPNPSATTTPAPPPSPPRPTESFTVTREDDPLPPPTPSGRPVSVPKSPTSNRNKKRRLEPIPKAKLTTFWRGRSDDEELGWRVLSWDPPVNGMSKRSMSRDEVVFGLSGGGWGSKISTKGSNVKVLLPKERVKNERESGEGTSAAGGMSVPQSTSDVRMVETVLGSGRSDLSPRLSFSKGKLLPAGTEVAFYKPPQVVISTAAVSISGSEEPSTGIRRDSLVRFMVTSELEGDTSNTVDVDEAQPESLANDDVPPAAFNESTQSDEKSDETPSSLSNSASTLLTPPPPVPETATATATSPWAKSPLVFNPVSPNQRGPNQEHLKAVWSQGPEETVNVENSLKDISDEFPGTTLPHSVQDMKSDDGGDGGAKSEATSVATPTEATDRVTTAGLSTNPKPSRPEGTPSRMSLRDAHRAFQQVPPSPAHSNSSVPSYNPLGLMNHPTAPPNGHQARPPSSQSYGHQPQPQHYPHQPPVMAMTPHQHPHHHASPGQANFTVRPYQASGMMWNQPNLLPPPYTSAASSPGPARMQLPPHGVQAHTSGSGMPQGLWMPPHQGVPAPAPQGTSPYPAMNGQTQFVYMQPHPSHHGSMPKGVGHGAVAHHQPHPSAPSGMNGYLSPQIQRQPLATPVPANSHQQPGTPHFIPRQPVMSPHMYPNAALPHPAGYSVPVGSGRGNGHPGGPNGHHHHLPGPRSTAGHFELPPPPPPPNASMYAPTAPTRYNNGW